MRKNLTTCAVFLLCVSLIVTPVCWLKGYFGGRVSQDFNNGNLNTWGWYNGEIFVHFSDPINEMQKNRDFKEIRYQQVVDSIDYIKKLIK